ncbi:hypothetical protein FACS1894111_00800 [Clostridia bacterium]|nr:hypothetical protein FACS1894111_00800 [Clostridia bacterium]
MNIVGIVQAALIVGGTGALIGFFLCFAGEKLKVEIDEREEKILALLPGVNCGACGHAGCGTLAAAIVEGAAKTNACPVGRGALTEQIGAIMSVSAE